MRSYLIAVGRRMPAWVTAGFTEYNKRLPRELCLKLIEITPAVRTKSTTTGKALAAEAQRIRDALPQDALVIALDEHGIQFNSQVLSRKIAAWNRQGRDLAFIIGGTDGIDGELKQTADLLWSLSTMTLPHALARIIVVEQIYRAWTILQNHPYHRE
ncbi:MAG: 23S rRNA (pseudouridine(1915)-N(3))-methyltransferase RlmH [Gammaproteobacteria bacterium]